MRARPAELLARIPGPATERWPTGAPFRQAIAHGTMSLELCVPGGADLQAPHEQDELHVVVAGEAVLTMASARFPCRSGDALFVPAGAEHRFVEMSADFVTWAISWGPPGGETDGA